MALASTLLRRLGRLRAAALRISAEGPTVSMPRDEGHDEVGDLARALGGMQEDLRRQESARRAFVATASHELRTPLTMLQGTMELLEEDLHEGQLDLTDAQRQVATARRELLRLSTLAEELLDLSRLDAAVAMRSEAVELGELARAVAAEFGLRAGEREIALEVVPPTGACWGRGDPDAVARVVRILIDNALRYGGGEPIRVTAAEGAGVATVEVADRGQGIPEEERERIFERFYRGRGRGSEGGFGLGLAIGQRARRAHGRQRHAVRPARRRHALRALAPAQPRRRRGARPGARPGRGQRRVLSSTVALTALGMRLLGVGGKTEVGWKRASLVTYWLNCLRAHAHELRPRRAPAGVVEDDRRDHHEPAAGREPVEDRLEVAPRRARAQPVDAVAPVGHADVARRSPSASRSAAPAAGSGAARAPARAGSRRRRRPG